MALQFKKYTKLHQDLPDNNLANLRIKFQRLQDLFLSEPYNGDSTKIQYSGSILFWDLLKLYLAQKYKNRCVIELLEPQDDAILYAIMNPLTRYLDVRKLDVDTPNPTQLNIAAESLVKCIKQPGNTFVIPFYFEATFSLHANLLIFHKQFNTLEHFDPAGKANSVYSTRLQNRIQILVDKVNELLVQQNEIPITYVTPVDVCPYTLGPQTHQLAVSEPNQIIRGGLCLAWSMLIAVLSLENPNLLTQNIVGELLDYSMAVGHKTYPEKYVKDTNRIMTREEIILARKGDEKAGVVLRNIVLGFIISMQKELDTYIQQATRNSQFHNIKTYKQFLEKFNTSSPVDKGKLGFIPFHHLVKHGSDMLIDKIINDIPDDRDPNRFTSLSEYKTHIENNIAEAKRRIAEIQPRYELLLNELEQIRPEYDRLKDRTVSKLMRKTRKIVGIKKQDKYQEFKKISKELVPLEMTIASLHFTIAANQDILETIEENPESLRNSPIIQPSVPDTTLPKNKKTPSKRPHTKTAKNKTAIRSTQKNVPTEQVIKNELFTSG